MTIAPGYYWIRWPNSRDESDSAWQPAYVFDGGRLDGPCANVLGRGGAVRIYGAELGPRVEPPSSAEDGL